MNGPDDVRAAHEPPVTGLRAAAMPEFAHAFRGYDRGQVDDYVRRLRSYGAEQEERRHRAEQRVRELERLLAELTEPGDVPRQPRTGSPAQ